MAARPAGCHPQSASHLAKLGPAAVATVTPDGEQGGPSIRAGRQVAFPRFGVESRDDLDELQLGDLDEMPARCPGAAPAKDTNEQ